MRNLNPFLILLISSLLFLPGCGVITAIFQAGFWSAIILIVAVIALATWGISSYRSNSRDTKDTSDRDI